MVMCGAHCELWAKSKNPETVGLMEGNAQGTAAEQNLEMYQLAFRKCDFAYGAVMMKKFDPGDEYAVTLPSPLTHSRNPTARHC